jgi:hypothetical protein
MGSQVVTLWAQYSSGVYIAPIEVLLGVLSVVGIVHLQNVLVSYAVELFLLVLKMKNMKFLQMIPNQTTVYPKP